MPSYVKEYAFFWWDTQSAQATNKVAAHTRDNTDPLVQSFMDFVVGKKKAQVKENFAAPMASAVNTPGVGNVVPPTLDTKGSGDTFSASSKSKKRKKKRYAEGYEDWLKNTIK